MMRYRRSIICMILCMVLNLLNCSSATAGYEETLANMWFNDHTLTNHPESQLIEDFDRIGLGIKIFNKSYARSKYFNSKAGNKEYYWAEEKEARKYRDTEKYTIYYPKRPNGNYIMESEAKKLKWGMTRQQVAKTIGDATYQKIMELSNGIIELYDSYIAGHDAIYGLTYNAKGKLSIVDYGIYFDSSIGSEKALKYYEHLQSQLATVYKSPISTEENKDDFEYKSVYRLKKTEVKLRLSMHNEKFRISVLASYKK